MVAVVAAVRREVEGDRQAHLPGREVLAVERVRLLGGGEAGVLPDRPRPVRVHRRPRTAHERLHAGQAADRLELLEISRRVERLHVDALGRVPGQRVGISTSQLGRREPTPVIDRVTHAASEPAGLAGMPTARPAYAPARDGAASRDLVAGGRRHPADDDPRRLSPLRSDHDVRREHRRNTGTRTAICSTTAGGS